jgi:pseudouridine-5'-phosphate glycosidase
MTFPAQFGPDYDAKPSSRKGKEPAMTVDICQGVQRALDERRAVVALESTLICHGIPRPRNAALAHAIEAAVRAAGAEPATIAVLDGRVKIGLDAAELDHLASITHAAKCSTRDLPSVIAARRPGATTVAATIFLARRVGIEVMATGGLGGVHQGGESSMDVSADLEELARTRVAVVCSGIKSILDAHRTLERLETLGVPILGYRCAELPSFYSAESGLSVPEADSLEVLCRLIEAHAALELPGGVVVVQPPPSAHAMAKARVDQLVAQARAAARQTGVSGPAETPFMLRHMAETSGGATVDVNCALALANADLAGRLAAALAERRADRAAGPTRKHLDA